MRALTHRTCIIEDGNVYTEVHFGFTTKVQFGLPMPSLYTAVRYSYSCDFTHLILENCTSLDFFYSASKARVT